MKNDKKFYTDLEVLMAFMPNHVYWLDRNNVYQGCNDTQARSMGLKTRHEIVGKKNSDIYTGLDNKTLIEILDKNNLEVMETGQAKVVEELTALNGAVKIFLSNKVPLYDKNNNVIGLLGMSVDISDRKEQIEATFEQMIAHMPGHVYWLDKNNVYLGCNDLQAKHLGFSSRQEIVGKTNYDLAWKEQAADLNTLNTKVMETGKVHIAEEFAVLADGKQGTFLSQKVPLRDKEENIIGVLGISMDITERKKMEQELAEQVVKTQKANRSKTIFLETASHEVRGPVGNIIALTNDVQSYIEKLRSIVFGKVVELVTDREEKRELIDILNNCFANITDEISTSNAEAQRTLDALINLSEIHRIELEGVKSQPEETNIDYLIQQALDETKTKFEHFLDKNNISLIVNVSPKIPTTIHLDKKNILQALKIIIGNAIRFSHEKSNVIVTADIEKQNDNEFINIKVEDFGTGISEEHLNIILDNTLAEEEQNGMRTYKKPSLRLTQAKLRLEASGGKIKIESAPEKGTAVTLQLPLNASNQKSSNEKTSRKNVASSNKVLLMEDDALTQAKEKQYLEKCGCTVDAVSLGIDAINLIKKNKYQAVFLDITVPDIDGLEVMKIIKTIDPEVAVVAITSHVSSHNQEYFQDEGFDAVLTKPVNQKKLKDVVELIFDAHGD